MSRLPHCPGYRRPILPGVVNLVCAAADTPCMADFYQRLGVSPKAPQDEIRRVYRQLARQYHPDRNPGDRAAEAKFIEINEANATLCDPEKRSRYDKLLGARDFNARAGRAYRPGKRRSGRPAPLPVWQPRLQWATLPTSCRTWRVTQDRTGAAPETSLPRPQPGADRREAAPTPKSISPPDNRARSPTRRSCSGDRRDLDRRRQVEAGPGVVGQTHGGAALVIERLPPGDRAADSGGALFHEGEGDVGVGAVTGERGFDLGVAKRGLADRAERDPGGGKARLGGLASTTTARFSRATDRVERGQSDERGGTPSSSAAKAKPAMASPKLSVVFPAPASTASSGSRRARPAASQTSTSASSASSAGMLSPHGKASATLPPTVARLRICSEPTAAAAKARQRA